MVSRPPSINISALRAKMDPTPCGIVRELCRAGYEAYIVGGAIRDLLLGNTPKDYDISTSATPEQVRQVFGRRRCHVIGRRFRLAHVYANGELYEVSTFRRVPDAQERQGRKSDAGPIIWNDNCFGTLDDDAKRRDFTANALYYDVTGDRGIIDFSGGLQDIQDGIVRCIGVPSERLEEDPVRMLRALKLVGQCDFRLESQLEQAIRKDAQQIHLSSPSRLFEELLKLLNHPAADHTLQVMHDFGFLQYFWPTLNDSWDEQEGQLVQHLLHLRGAAIRKGHYSNSRGLALSTVCLPFMMTALNPENPTQFWTRSPMTDDVAHRALGLVFDGFQIPHIFSVRILEIIGLVPRLLTPPVSPKTLNHQEYRYGRALAALLIQLFGWDPHRLDALPEFAPREFTEEEFNEEEEMVPDAKAAASERRRPAPPPAPQAPATTPRPKAIPGLLPLKKNASPAAGTPVNAAPAPAPVTAPPAVVRETPAAPLPEKAPEPIVPRTSFVTADPSVPKASTAAVKDGESITFTPAAAHEAVKKLHRARRRSEAKADAEEPSSH